MDGERLDDWEVSLVLRRAAELDHRPASGPPGVDLEAVEEAAAEVGLSPASVRRAVAELRAGALTAAPGPASRRVLGPPTLTVWRAVPGPAPAVTAWLHDFLGRQLFCLRRDQDGPAPRGPNERSGLRGPNAWFSLWERRDDMAAGLRRGLDSFRERRLVLNDVHRLQVAVVEEPGGGDRVVVRLELDVRSARWTQTAVVASGGALGAAVVAGWLLTGPDPATALALPAAGGVVVGGHRMGNWFYRRQVAELELAAEGVLDRLERREISGRPSRSFPP